MSKVHMSPMATIRLARGAVTVVACVTALGTMTLAEGATPPFVALSIAQHAVITAENHKPPQVVTAADVRKAASLASVNTSNLRVLFNLDDVLGFSRVVLFFDLKSFTDTCVKFPMTIGGAPSVVPCSRQARGLWNSLPAVIGVSRDAISAAAAQGKAVSGADVVAANAKWHLLLAPHPSFEAGRGGKVKFGTLVEIGQSKFTVYICMEFPKQVAGRPVQVAC